MSLLHPPHGVRAAGTTYYVAPAGSDASPCTETQPCRQIRKALTLVQPGDVILVADGSYKGFDVRDVHGTPDAPITIAAPGSAAVITPTADRPDNRDNILVTFSSHVVLDGLRSFNAPRAGLRVDQSDRITVRNGVFGTNGKWGIFTDFSDDLRIVNNRAYGSRDEHGIYVSNSGDRPVVRGNVVYGNRASGIQLNADLSQGGDGLITGALIENNLVSDNGETGGAALNLDGVQASTVRNNILYGNHATGIALFQIDGAAGPKGMKIYHNTIDVAADGRYALLVSAAAGANQVRNNIFCNRNTARGAIVYESAADVSRTDSDYNIFCETPYVGLDGGDRRVSLSRWKALGHEPHSFTAGLNGLFVSPGTGDYHLRAGSPALDRAVLLPAVLRDFEGTRRPAGPSPDIGADERPL